VAVKIDKYILCSSEPTVALHLNIIAIADVSAFYTKLDPAATPENVADAFRHIKAKRPPRGHLIIELNKGEERGRCFLPKDLVGLTYMPYCTISTFFFSSVGWGWFAD
jgi:hypothetical protein